MIQAMIEIEAHSKLKYEKDARGFVLDRILNQKCPAAYGYVPYTKGEDGDPLDIFIISQEKIPMGTKVNVLPIGVFSFVDNGEQDDKIVAIVPGENLDAETIQIIKNNIARYLATYKPNCKLDDFYPADLAYTLTKKYSDYTQ